MPSIPFSVEVIALGAVIAQGFLSSVILGLKPQNRLANCFLALLLLTFSLWLCDSFFRVAGIYQQDPNYYFLPIYYSLGFGPFLYFYSQSITKTDYTLRLPQLLHFLPLVLQAALYIFLQTQDYSFRRWFWMEVHYPYTYGIEFNLSLLSLLIYGAIAVVLIRNYQKKIKNQYSEISKISLSWLLVLVIIILSLTFAWILDAFLRSFYHYYAATPYSAIVMGIALLALAIGGILQGRIKIDSPIKESSLSPTLDDVKPVDETLLQKIKKVMEEEACYLQTDLSLSTLAATLGSSPKEVSYQINQGLQVNFMDFVNAYRVESVKAKIIDPDYAHYTLLGMALESGFNSKSTFNRVFKKKEGISPSEYRKRTQNRN